MYAKYHSNAFVLGSDPRGETDRVVRLYTREFGLIRARAGAVRHELSRMRYALQHFSEARVSLVKGQAGWRVVGAHALSEAPEGLSLRAFARIALLLERLVVGEESHKELYDVLGSAHAGLRLFPQTWSHTELLTVARILCALGYLSQESFAHVALGTALEAPVVLSETNRDALLRSVNEALAETNL